MVQMVMSAEGAEIAEEWLVQLAMVDSMSALILAAIEYGARGVLRTRQPDMMNSMF